MKYNILLPLSELIWLDLVDIWDRYLFDRKLSPAEFGYLKQDIYLAVKTFQWTLTRAYRQYFIFLWQTHMWHSVLIFARRVKSHLGCACGTDTAISDKNTSKCQSLLLSSCKRQPHKLDSATWHSLQKTDMPSDHPNTIERTNACCDI